MCLLLYTGSGFCLFCFGFLLYTGFLWLCGRRARRKEGLMAGGMPPAIFNELSGPAAGDKREKAEGSVLG